MRSHALKKALPLKSILRIAGILILGVFLLLLTLWAVAALYFDVRVAWLRSPLAFCYALGILVIWVTVKKRKLATGLTVGAFALVLGWWLTLKPSNDRDWQPDVATLSYADIQNNRVTIHNIRNCDYRTETDYVVRHYDKTYDLSKLQSADLFMVYWGAPYMAHVMISFGFGNDEYLCFSIETRKKKGENYSAVKGLFRQFEIIYIVGDERDLVRLRTNYRQGEDAYLFRLNLSRNEAREMLLDYLTRVNSLKEHPEWYNAITQNCTTSIRTQRQSANSQKWDWRMLANGYGDEMLYERGQIPTNLPLATLKKKVHINARAQSANTNSNFSHIIRQGLPGVL